MSLSKCATLWRVYEKSSVLLSPSLEDIKEAATEDIKKSVNKFQLFYKAKEFPVTSTDRFLKHLRWVGAWLCIYVCVRRERKRETWMWKNCMSVYDCMGVCTGLWINDGVAEDSLTPSRI